MILLPLREIQLGVQFYSIRCEFGALQDKEWVFTVNMGVNVDGLCRCKRIVEI
jgi:hypothetical protein